MYYTVCCILYDSIYTYILHYIYKKYGNIIVPFYVTLLYHLHYYNIYILINYIQVYSIL